MKTELGKIIAIRVGLIGRDDNSFGVHFTLGGRDGWRVDTSLDLGFEANVDEFATMLRDAGVNDAAKLVGKPVQATFETQTLKSWRLLTECL